MIASIAMFRLMAPGFAQNAGGAAAQQPNPLLQKTKLPQFDKIRPEHFKPAIEKIIKENRAVIKKILAQKKYTWNNLIEPLENANERLGFVWSAINHLNSVVGAKEVRIAYEQCLPLVTKYFIEISQNSKIYNAFDSVAKSKQYNDLDPVQKRIIGIELRDFRLAGVNLPAQKKQIFMKQTQKLAELGNKFGNNVVDATQGWSICLDKKQTKGLPEHALAFGRANAEKKKKDGWCYSLDAPSYQALMTFADSRAVRKKVYVAFVTRASDIGPGEGKWDNSKAMQEVLKIRRKLSGLVGFNNYAQYSLATKMAKDPEQVLDFLNDLAVRTLPNGKKEAAELKEFAKKNGVKKLEPWDIAYYSEKLSQKKFKLSQEELRPYFPVPQVLQGMFKVAHRLFGIIVKEKKDVSVWNPDVRFFEVYDSDGELRGQFYIDLYVREDKRGGAWMGGVVGRSRLKNGAVQIPVAYLICNFPPQVDGHPSLLTHYDVTTLFHEFGHCLHHLLTKIDYGSAAGINNVPWDAVELPSQLMENWCWQEDSLKLIAKHYKTKEPLPKKLLQRLLASHKFQAALQMLRQLKFSLIDFRIHTEFNPKQNDQLKKTTDQVSKQVDCLPIFKDSRFAHSFSHIFAGGYAAGYYSYKWAEVLSADAFSKFEEKGVFSRRIGKEFMQNILEKGGSEDMSVLFKRFRGRDPKINALLRHNGIIQKTSAKHN
jgi:oligopeptidase A